MDKTEIQEDIKNRIFLEQLRPGQFLIERECCQQYGISRTPMREILWGLAAEGLLTRQAGKGFTVRTLDWKQLNEVYEVREGFEGLAARLCCRKLTKKGKKLLLELKKKLERLNKNIDEEGVRLGRVLHRFIIDEADNSLLTELYGKVGTLILLTTILTKKSGKIEELSRLEHIHIIEEILMGRAEAAEDRMRAHIRSTYNRLHEQLLR